MMAVFYYSLILLSDRANSKFAAWALNATVIPFEKRIRSFRIKDFIAGHNRNQIFGVGQINNYLLFRTAFA